MIKCAQCGKEKDKKKDHRYYTYHKQKKGKKKEFTFCTVECIKRWRTARLKRFKSLDKSIEKAEDEVKTIVEEKNTPSPYETIKKTPSSSTTYGKETAAAPKNYTLKPVKIKPMVGWKFGENIDYDDYKWDSVYQFNKSLLMKEIKRADLNRDRKKVSDLYK